MPERIEVVEADITELAVDAIVNAANPSLPGGCATGNAKATRGYRLLARCYRGCLRVALRGVADVSLDQHRDLRVSGRAGCAPGAA